MINNKIIPVVLSGGSGTRLWPLSREEYPKQYLRLVSENTMLQETLLRLKVLTNLASPIVVCSHHHRFLVAEQLQQIDIESATILLEPSSRNTAPAIAAAAMKVLQDNESDMLLVLPADHFIENVDLFHEAIQIAVEQAQNAKLVTFGVFPTSPNSNFGYIKADYAKKNYCNVKEFIEKPSQKSAKKFIDQGNYLWNSGIFLFRADTFVKELSLHSNEISKKIKKSFDNAVQDLDFIRLEKSSFESSPNNSIDYELMEKSDNVVVVPLDIGWSDIGSWSALYELSKKDINGNVINGDVITEDTINCYIHSENRLLTTVGLKDLCIIDTPDAILIANKDETNKVKKILKQLNKKNRKEQSFNRKVYRPWGWFDVIEIASNFQVKRLHVNSGEKLSLQYHNMRDEHWVVVKGVATVVNGSEHLILKEGQSTYIPKKVQHSLSNKEVEPLELIEIQSGTYLGEDDIVRLQDIYGRIKK